MLNMQLETRHYLIVILIGGVLGLALAVATFPQQMTLSTIITLVIVVSVVTAAVVVVAARRQKRRRP